MKTPLNKSLVYALLSFFAFFSITFFSCVRDKCKSTVCANGGVCNGGTCTCPTGYEGAGCNTVSRDKFLGTWEVFEQGSVTTKSQYNTTIASGLNINEIIINNFYNYFTEYVYATVHLDTMFIVSQQYQGKLIYGGFGVVTPNTNYGENNYMVVRYEIIDTATQLVNDFGIYPQDGSKPSAWYR